MARSHKVYLHWEGEPPLTKVVKLSNADTTESLQRMFLDALRAHARQHELPAMADSATELRLRRPNGRLLPPETLLAERLANGEDVFVELSRGPPRKPAATPGCVPPAPPQPSPALTAAEQQGVPPKAANPTDGAAVPGQHLVRALWQRAEDAAGARNYRVGAEALQQALAATTDVQLTHETTVRLARLWLRAGNPAAAVKWAQEAGDERPEDATVLELLGDCLRDSGHPREAAAHYQSALEALEDGVRPQEGVIAANKGAASDGPSTAAPKRAAALLRLRLSLAASLYDVEGTTDSFSNQDLAASLVMAALEHDPANWNALKLYARIALDRGIRDDALRVALRLVVQKSADAGAKALLAECLQDETDCRMLFAELGVPLSGDGEDAPSASANESGVMKTSSAAAALGFVATAVKDHGKVDSCIALLQRALHLEPNNASYCLNLVHALELRQDLNKAVVVGRRYLRESGARLAGSALKDVEALLQDLPELRCAVDLTWLLHGSGRALDGVVPTAAAPAAPASSTVVTYTPDELDQLALLFTLVKILFVGGALEAAARLCISIEPLRRASAVELHTTLIRNEAAYFGCVLQLLQAYPLSPARELLSDDPSDVLRPLYLCGDSHCLSAAWRTVTLRMERRLLRPLLVTGCKIWHLRPASAFYPKIQFNRTIQMLPDGAQVLLVLGEIDCREGLLLAVQKGKYDSVLEGINATVSIFLEQLRVLVATRRMELFVHPIPPVLNETRHIVMPFTAVLREAIAAARKADAQLHSNLHYLDFFDQLLVDKAPLSGRDAAASDVEAAQGAGGGHASSSFTPPPTGKALSPDLVFDGTHLNPVYARLLDAAMQGVE